jgi:hypothetical protein
MLTLPVAVEKAVVEEERGLSSQGPFDRRLTSGRILIF